MNIWLLDLLPYSFFHLLAPLSLILIGYLVEKHYTGRVTMFANAIALVTFFGIYEIVPPIIILYTNIVTLLGVVGIISYTFKFKLFESYYTAGKIASSIITGLVIIWGASNLS
ncbi:MAG: hypothetical protein ACMXYL_01255 [Candidatus Woesearchaeota archaeon]